MEHMLNNLRLTGKLMAEPVMGYEAFGEVFYSLTLSVLRLSGMEDLLPVTISERLLSQRPLTPGMMLSIEGQVRSYNRVTDGAGRLVITAFARRLAEADAWQNPNVLQLTGLLCKPPVYRTTPFGREIADLMLAVNRDFGKSAYLPCVAWGYSARFASRLQVGNHVSLTGRFQSRSYQKQTPHVETVEKVAYEVSVSHIIPVQERSPSFMLKTD